MSKLNLNELRRKVVEMETNFSIEFSDGENCIALDKNHDDL